VTINSTHQPARTEPAAHINCWRPKFMNGDFLLRVQP
jgi:hypothetical protein